MLVYILKSTFCLVLLLGIYHLFLEKEKMHTFNRFYLLGSILFSFLVPSFTITVAPEIIETPLLTETASLHQFSIDSTPQQQIIETIDYTRYIIILFALISSILLVLLSKKIHNLLNKAKQNRHINYFSATVVLLKERVIPYSFLHYIFINKHTYKTESIETQILTHELAHVEQKHSIDVLFIEVLQNLFWFNPIFRYYKKAIQLNHEFLADDAVINSHKNISEYQQLLLNVTAQNNNIYLASNLNYSLTKKRLLMMTTPSSKTKILLKKLMVVPLIIGFIFAFAQRVEAQKKKKTLPKVVEVQLKKKGIHDDEMKEYKAILKKIKSSKPVKEAQSIWMLRTYKKMSSKQQKSVGNLYTYIPENLFSKKQKPQVREIELKNPPKVDLVYTYKRLAKRIQRTSKNRKANIAKLKQLYYEMSPSQQRKVISPSKIPVKIEVVEKKKKSKKRPRPVSIKVVEKKESKELKELIEEEEKVVEQHELREVEEGILEEETEVVVDKIEPIEDVEVIEEVESIETPEVIEIVEEEKEDLTKDLIVNLQNIKKSKLKKEYYINNKKVSERKFNRLNIKKIKNLRIEKGNLFKIYISTK